MSYVRPKIRKASNNKVGESKIQNDNDVEAVRVKMGQWMGLKDPQSSDVNEVVSNESDGGISGPWLPQESLVAFSQENVDEEFSPSSKHDNHDNPKELKSILKRPKYSSAVQIQQVPLEGNLDDDQEEPENTRKKKSVFKQDRIQEREPSHPNGQPKVDIASINQSSAMSVEGYEPQMDHNKRIASTALKNDTANNATEQQHQRDEKEEEYKDDAEGEPLILNSLADMMEIAGTLPSQDLNDNPQVVEAELEFSCLSPEEYRQQLILQGIEEQEAAEKMKSSDKPEWRYPNQPVSIPDDGYTGGNPVSDDEEHLNENSDNDSKGGFGFWDLMGDEEDEEEAVVAPPRAFRIIWECLSPLITPESGAFLRRLKREHDMDTGTGSYLITATPNSELELSRSNGFMAMLRMYLSRSLKELGQAVETRRKAEQRLQGLLYTFSFSRPAAKLETAQWKALTCILLEVVLFLGDASHGAEPASTSAGESGLPRSVQSVGMTNDEYHYLVKNTFRVLDIPDPII